MAQTNVNQNARYSDIDTLIINHLVPLESFLPPPGEDPFMMMSGKLAYEAVYKS